MIKHTPGPWHARVEWKPGVYEIKDRQSFSGYAPIAKVVGDKRWTAAHAAANARLIAAAPELLEALMNLLSTPDFDGTQKTSIARRETKRAARAVVAKALGEKE
jgi:hypothetical protein